MAFPTMAAPPLQSINLLKNPDFGQKLVGWKTWFYEDIHYEPDDKKAVDVFRSFLRPGFKISEPKWDKVTRGEDDKGAAGSASGRKWTKFRAGFYQTVNVAPGSRVLFSVWVNGFCEEENKTRCPVLLRAGIDPNGGTDWQSEDIQWVEVQVRNQEYVLLIAPEVQVPTGHVTVFTWGEPLLPVIYNAAYFDEASLVITVPPTPTGAAPTAPPSPPTPVPCAQMRFESDVTIPENSPLAPGDQFVKTWRIRNSGTCAWSGSLNFVGSGSRMGGESPIALPKVQVGQSADISLNLVAPREPGSYLGTWEARTNEGIILGRLLVKINVVNETPTPTSLPMIATATPQSMATPYPANQICILAFDDKDGNGQQEAEGPLAGVVFTLMGSDGLTETFMTDGASEPHCFAGLPQSYQLTMEPPEGYVETTAKTATVVLEDNMKIVVSFGAMRSELVATSVASVASATSVASTPGGDENIGVPALEGGIAGTGLSAPALAAMSVIIVLGITIGYLKTRRR